MMRVFFFVLFCLGLEQLFCAPYDCAESNTWVTLPSLPEATAEVASAIIDNKLYVAGEQNTATYVYDLIENKWSKAASRVFQGNHQNAVVINGEWWLIGGIDADSYGKLQIYNPSKDEWRHNGLKDMPWDGGSVNSVYNKNENKIYVCGGIQGFDNGKNGGGTNTTNLCAIYDIQSNTWKMNGVMPFGRNHAAMTLDTDTNQFWIIGGRIGKNVPSNGFTEVQIYDLKNKTWVTSVSNHNIKPLPVARGGTGHSVYHNHKFYVFGGETESDNVNATKNWVYNRTDIYDLSKNQWISGKVMPVPRHGIFPVYYNNAIYIAGGGIHHGYSTSSTFDKYCI